MPDRMMSPPQVAKLFGVSHDKILGLIKRGELLAYNLAASPGGRPRFKIRPADLEAFLLRRSVVPAILPARRRRRVAPTVKEWF